MHHNVYIVVTGGHFCACTVVLHRSSFLCDCAGLKSNWALVLLFWLLCVIVVQQSLSSLSLLLVCKGCSCCGYCVCCGVAVYRNVN